MILRTQQFVKTASLLTALLMAMPSFAERATFSSPSGNITCYLEDHGVFDVAERPLVCIVFEADWPVLPHAGSEECDLDAMHQIVMYPAGIPEPMIGCHGDVFWPLPEVKIGYGSTWSVTGYTCDMATTGVSCQNTDGHGFKLRRAAVEVY